MNSNPIFDIQKLAEEYHMFIKDQLRQCGSRTEREGVLLQNCCMTTREDLVEGLNLENTSKNEYYHLDQLRFWKWLLSYLT